jgi:hypothetical protein
MTGATCLICLVPANKIKSPLGNAGEPIGCCKRCYSLVCGHHGHRDPNTPSFLCALCVSPLAAAAAASVLEKDTEVLNQLRKFFPKNEELIPVGILGDGELDYFEQWNNRYENLAKRVKDVSIRANEGVSQDMRQTISLISESPRARKLLVIAYLIVLMYAIPDNHVPEVLRQLFEAIKWQGI